MGENKWKSKDLRERTKKFALDILALSDQIPNTSQGRTVKNQMNRSGTSVGANYRAAQRGKSAKDFISKMSIVEEEADETAFWLEILNDSKILVSGEVERLRDEAEQITKICVSSIGTARKNS